MKKSLILFSILLFSLAAQAEGAAGEKNLLGTKILFNEQGKAKVSYNIQGQSVPDITSNKIQSAMIFYAFAMNRIPDGERVPLMNQMQKLISRVATEEGIQRPDIILGNPLLAKIGSDAKGKGFELDFGAISGQGNSLDVKPLAGSDNIWGPSVIYLFQDLIKNVPDSGLRLVALSLGGMNKWYREKGKASDPNSVSQAPAYGLNLAVDILSKLSGQKI